MKRGSVAEDGAVLVGRRDVLPFAEEKLAGSDSESEEDVEPWDQPGDVDAQPSPEAERRGVCGRPANAGGHHAALGANGRGACAGWCGTPIDTERPRSTSGPGLGGDGDLLIEARNFPAQGHGNVHPR